MEAAAPGDGDEKWNYGFFAPILVIVSLLLLPGTAAR